MKKKQKNYITNTNPATYKMKNLILLIVLALLLSGCADAENVNDCLNGHQYGFWGGLWHGFIMIFNFIGMIIWDDVAIYAPNNNGIWYALGFMLGNGSLLSFVKGILNPRDNER